MGDSSHPLGSFENPYPADYPVPPPILSDTDPQGDPQGSFVNPYPHNHPLPSPIFDETTPQYFQDFIRSRQPSQTSPTPVQPAPQAAPKSEPASVYSPTEPQANPAARSQRHSTWAPTYSSAHQSGWAYTSSRRPPRRESPPPPYQREASPPSRSAPLSKEPAAAEESPLVAPFHFTGFLTGDKFEGYDQEALAAVFLASTSSDPAPSQYQGIRDRGHRGAATPGRQAHAAGGGGGSSAAIENHQPGYPFFYTHPVTGERFAAYNQGALAALMPPTHSSSDQAPPPSRQRTRDRRGRSATSGRRAPARATTALTRFSRPTPSGLRNTWPRSSNNRSRHDYSADDDDDDDDDDEDARSDLSVTVHPAQYAPGEGWVTRWSLDHGVHSDEDGYVGEDERVDEDEWAEIESLNGEAGGPQMGGALRGAWR